MTKRVYWSLADGMVALVADVPKDAVFLGTGPMPEEDDYIGVIDWTARRYRTDKRGWVDFPETVLQTKDCDWRLYRVGTRFYE